MTYYEYLYRKVPEYYPTMYQDGFTPDEILHALRRKMMRQYEERMTAETEIGEFKITSEVKIK